VRWEKILSSPLTKYALARNPRQLRCFSDSEMRVLPTVSIGLRALKRCDLERNRKRGVKRNKKFFRSV